MGNNRNADQTHNRQQYGPHRVAGFSPIPAMSMVSHAVGARFISLIGGSMLSFYDWYADLPVASPQVFGMGSVAGVLLLLGLAILIARHQLVGPVFSATTRNDKAMYLVLSVVILLGLWTTVRVNVADGGYDHRETVSPWFRSLFILQPDPELRVGVPLGLQLHGECVGIVRDLAVHPAHPRLQRGGGPARLPNPPVDGPDRTVGGSAIQASRAAMRLPVTWYLSGLYAVGFGGFVAFSVYLPTYLRNAYELLETDAGARTAGFVLVAIVARPIGGWLSDRWHPSPVLVTVSASPPHWRWSPPSRHR